MTGETDSQGAGPLVAASSDMLTGCLVQHKKTLNFPEDNIKKAFHKAWVFPVPPTAGEDSGRKRVSVLIPGASVAFSLVLMGKKNRKLTMFTTM